MPSFNKGDVSEGILAAAITARFVSKSSRISEQDVVRMIKRLNRGQGGFKGVTSLTYFGSPNKNTKIVDEVCCKVNLAENNMKAFLDPKTYASTNKDINALVKAAVQYANSNNIIKWADLMYENNQKNKIEVNAEGLLDQTGTKVDLKVIIDGKQAGVGVSLKAGDVKQFGQVGGSKFGSMKTLWGPLGVKYSGNFEKEYEEMLSKKEVAPALTGAYKEAVRQIKKLSQEQLQKSLATFMDKHATSGEKDVVLVQLNRGEVTVYDFKNIQKKLLGQEITVNLTSGSTNKLNDGGFKGKSSAPKNKIPKVEFLVDGKVLVSVRLKLEGNRVNSKGKRLPLVVRSYVEKGPMTTQLIGS